MPRSICYDLSKFDGCTDQEGRKIMAFTIRSTDGTDEAHAAKVSEASDTQMTEELIRFSIVSYATSPTGHSTANVYHKIDHTVPFKGFDQWSTKARNFVVGAWRKLSTPDEKELADFFASGTESSEAKS